MELLRFNWTIGEVQLGGKQGSRYILWAISIMGEIELWNVEGSIKKVYKESGRD